MSRPPGPRLPSAAQTLMFIHDPARLMKWARRRYGPVFQIKFVGFPAEVFVANAELAERVYALDAGGGRAGEVWRRTLGTVIGPGSLLCLDGDAWWRHRRMLSPPLHGRAIRDYGDRIAEIAAEEIDRWPVGRPFALRDATQRIALEVILRLVFGVRDTARLARLRTLIPRFTAAAESMLVWTVPRRIREWAETSRPVRRLPVPLGRFLRLRDALDELIYAEIAERRAGAPDPGATDVLSLLLAARDADGRPLSDRELRDELITMVEAGHETTATGLAWAFERLLRTPRVLSRLLDELDSGDGETYLEAVVKETLRCRPVLFDAARLVDEPLRLGDHTVPKGFLAAPMIYLIHRDPEAFPDPEEFRPERFLGEEAARSAKSWMPFGGGRRYCVGAQLALLEMRVVITEVLRRVELHAPDPAPETPRMKHITLVPRRQTRVLITSRRTREPATA